MAGLGLTKPGHDVVGELEDACIYKPMKPERARAQAPAPFAFWTKLSDHERPAPATLRRRPKTRIAERARLFYSYP
jgi:hypothetical protein